MDNKLNISKYPDRTPKGQLCLDKLGQTLQGVPKCKALGLVFGMPSAIVLASPDDLHKSCIQDYKSAHSMPILGAAFKLHMCSLTQDKVYL